MQRVVVTGMGLVTPIGCDLETFERRMFAGDSGTRNIRGSLVAENFPVPHAALVNDKDLHRPEVLCQIDPQNSSRFWLLTAMATEQALQGLPKTEAIDAIVYGTAEGVSFELVFETLKTLRERGHLDGFDWRHARTESSLDMLNAMLAASGHPTLSPNRLIALNSACASGNQAIETAFHRIRGGVWKRALAGGVDARCTASSLMNFHMLSAVAVNDVPSETASRPFSGDRCGFVRGEGAATLMLESYESAKARGAKIYGEIIGAASTSDAWRLTDGREDAASVIEAMAGAVRDAGLDLSKIDYINAHGTSTPLNDRLETLAIKKLFGERAYQIPVSSLKSQIGHSTVAAGAIEAIACLLMLRAQKLAPTINYAVKDPECDLDYVPNKSRDARLNYVLSNSFGFGGQNSCLVLKGFDT